MDRIFCGILSESAFFIAAASWLIEQVWSSWMKKENVLFNDGVDC
jgi:hypothetical protein